MVSVAVPRSSGRLMVAAGPARVPVRSSEATWPGPESRAMALARMRLLTVSRSGAWSPAGAQELAVSLSSRSWSTRPVTIGTMVASHCVAGRGGGPNDPGRWSGGVAGGRGVLGSGGGRLRAWPVPGPADRRRAGRRRGPGLVEAGEFVEADVELDLGGLPGPVGQARRWRSAAGRPLRARRGGAAAGCGCLRARPSCPARPARPGRRRRSRGSGRRRAARRRRAWSAAAAAGPRTRHPRRRRARPAPPHLLGQPGQVGQLRAAGRRAEQDRVRVVAGGLGQLVGPVADLPAPTTPRSGPGQARRRRPGGRAAAASTPPLPDAAAAVTWVCHRSHVRGDRCPSSSYPASGSNADSTAAWAAVCTETARSSSRRHSACTRPAPTPGPRPASQPNPASTRPTASPADRGPAGPTAGRWPAQPAEPGGLSGEPSERPARPSGEAPAGPGWLSGEAPAGPGGLSGEAPAAGSAW